MAAQTEATKDCCPHTPTAGTTNTVMIVLLCIMLVLVLVLVIVIIRDRKTKRVLLAEHK